MQSARRSAVLNRMFARRNEQRSRISLSASSNGVTALAGTVCGVLSRLERTMISLDFVTANQSATRNVLEALLINLRTFSLRAVFLGTFLRGRY